MSYRFYRRWLIALPAIWFISMAAPAAAAEVAAPSKTVIQGTIVYSDGTPVAGKKFILAEVMLPSGQLLERINADGSMGIATGVTDEKGALRIEVDSAEFKDHDKIYSLISYPKNNRNQTPYSLTKKNSYFWLKITDADRLCDLDKGGQPVYTFPKMFDGLAAIQPLNASFDSLRFYESGDGSPAKEQRVYARQFSKAKARYINWEINLTHPKPGQRIDFTIEATWRRADGTVLTTQKMNSYIEADWTSSYHYWGWGAAKPGSWKSGEYWVIIYIDGKPVIAEPFSVTD